MKTTKKQLSPTSVELTVTLSADEVKDFETTALEHLAESVEVPGFRKGKVPTDVARKHINPNTLSSNALDLAVRQTSPRAFAEVDVMPLITPSVEVQKYVPGELLEYTSTVEIMPPIKLTKLSGLKVKREDTKVTAEDVDNTLKNLQKSYAEHQVVNRPAKSGDEVTIDFVGKKSGVAFDGGTANGVKITIGSNQFIPGFEDGVIGHKVGDEFDLDLTFPEDYHAKDLAGSKVVFTVLLKQVSETITPKLDDKFAAKCGPFKTLSALKDDIKQNLKSQNQHKALEKYKDDLITAVIAKSDIPTPEILISDHLKNIRTEVEQNVAHRGITFEQYLKTMDQTETQWLDDARNLAVTRVKASLALSQIAKDYDLTTTADEAEVKLAELRDVYKNAPGIEDQLADPRVKLDIAQRLTIEKAINKLVELNSK